MVASTRTADPGSTIERRATERIFDMRKRRIQLRLALGR